MKRNSKRKSLPLVANKNGKENSGKNQTDRPTKKKKKKKHAAPLGVPTTTRSGRQTRPTTRMSDSYLIVKRNNKRPLLVTNKTEKENRDKNQTDRPTKKKKHAASLVANKTGKENSDKNQIYRRTKKTKHGFLSQSQKKLVHKQATLALKALENTLKDEPAGLAVAKKHVDRGLCKIDSGRKSWMRRGMDWIEIHAAAAAKAMKVLEKNSAGNSNKLSSRKAQITGTLRRAKEKTSWTAIRNEKNSDSMHQQTTKNHGRNQRKARRALKVGEKETLANRVLSAEENQQSSTKQADSKDDDSTEKAQPEQQQSDPSTLASTTEPTPQQQQQQQETPFQGPPRGVPPNQSPVYTDAPDTKEGEEELRDDVILSTEANQESNTQQADTKHDDSKEKSQPEQQQQSDRKMSFAHQNPGVSDKHHAAKSLSSHAQSRRVGRNVESRVPHAVETPSSALSHGQVPSTLVPRPHELQQPHFVPQLAPYMHATHAHRPLQSRQPNFTYGSMASTVSLPTNFARNHIPPYTLAQRAHEPQQPNFAPRLAPNIPATHAHRPRQSQQPNFTYGSMPFTAFVTNVACSLSFPSWSQWPAIGYPAYDGETNM